jgi:DNA-binding response OmpR family regulator
MNKTILLADDSATIRRIVELAFTDTDFRVEAVASGGEALPLIDSLRPDLVLADVVMPEPTGYELCRTIKSSTQPVPVLLLTGTFEPFDPDLARECGADGHLVKPFESAALLERVEELLSPKPVEEPLEEAVEEPLEEELVTAIEAVVSEGAEAVADEPVEIPVKVEAPDDASGFEVRLSPDEIEAIANAVVARLSDQVIREIAREVVPELAAKIVRERIQELESES